MLAKLSVKKPYFIVVAVIIIIILGVVSYTNIGVDMLPGMNLPFIAVITINPGATPEAVEKELTDPIEEKLSTVSNVKELSSVSSEHFSMVLMEFNSNTDIDKAYSDVNEKIQTVSLPDNPLLQKPILMRVNPNMLPIMNVSVSMSGKNIKDSSADLMAVVEKLKAIDGVSSVSTNGLIGNLAYINLSVDKLSKELVNYASDKFDISFSVSRSDKKNIYDSIKANNVDTMTETEMLDVIIEQLNTAQDNGNNNLWMPEAIDYLTKCKTDTESEGYKICSQVLSNKFIFNENANENLFYTFIDNLTDAFINNMIGTRLNGVFDSINADLLSTLIFAQDFEMPAGTITEGVLETMVKVGPTIASREEFMTTPVISVNIGKAMSQYFDNVYAVLQVLTAVSGGKELKFTKAQLIEAIDLQRETNPTFDAMLGGAKTTDVVAQYVSALKMISNIVSDEAVTIPADEENGEFMVNTVKLDEELKALQSDLIVPLKLEGISDVTFFDTSTTTLTYMLTHQDEAEEFLKSGAVIFSVNKEPDRSTVEVTNGIIKMLDNLKKEGDFEGLTYTVLSNDGDAINFMLDTVVSNLLWGAVLAVIILLIFLKNIKATFVVGFSIVISVVSTFVMMYFANITLNIVSMGGLALGVGMLVDNSIVVLENIYRLKAQGKSKIVAAIQGAKQVGGAIVASTLTTVIVFLPIAFIQGMTKEIFTDMALTICFSLFASLISALTIVPMASSNWLKKPPKKDSKVFKGIKKSYARMLNFNLNHKVIPIVMIAVLLAFSIFSLLNMSVEMFPASGSQSFSITATVDRGGLEKYNEGKSNSEILTYDQALNFAMEQIENTLNGDVMVWEDPSNPRSEMVRYSAKHDISWRSAISSAGLRMASGMSFNGINIGDKTVNANIVLVKEKERKINSIELGKILDGVLNSPEVSKGVFVAKVANGDMMSSLGMGSNSVTVSLYGNDLDLLREQATGFADSFKVVNGNDINYTLDKVSSITTGLEHSDKEYRVIVDRAKANKYGLTVAQVYLQVQLALSTSGSSRKISFYDDNGAQYSSDIYAKGTNEYTKVWYKGKTESGEEVKIFVKNNISDEQAKGEYYLINDSGKGIFLVGNEEFSYIDNNLSIPLKAEVVDGKKYFTYSFVSELEGVIKATDVRIEQVDEQMYYEFGKYKALDLMTMDITEMDLSNMNSSDLSSMTSAVSGGTVVAKLYQLLDDGCFIRDANDNILYRETDIATTERIPLGLKKVDAFRSVSHVNKDRTVSITFLLDEGANSTAVKNSLEKAIKNFNFDSSITPKLVVGSTYVNEVFNTLYFILGLAIVLIYLIMVAQFQSLKSPFIIMFTVPLAFIGGVFALFFANQPLSVMALMGLIILVGVVVNNGIVFVDYCNQLIAKGVPKRVALLRTGLDRLRPILMTALTTIIALLIMALDMSENAAMLRPLAITTIGGMIFSTVMTLFIVPIIYDIFNRKKTQTDIDKLFADKKRMAELDIVDDGFDEWSGDEEKLINGFKNVEPYYFGVNNPLSEVVEFNSTDAIAVTSAPESENTVTVKAEAESTIPIVTDNATNLNSELEQTQKERNEVIEKLLKRKKSIFEDKE